MSPFFLQHSEKRSETYDSDDRAWAAGRGGDAASSKSQAHRLLIARALAGENIDDPAHRADSQDIRATRDCLKSLRKGGKLPVLECGESGSTLRFLIPVALALRGGGVFRGRGRLMDRPQEPYFRIFDGMGITHRREGDSLTVRGRLRPGEYPLPGDVSSQFVTGLLFLPCLCWRGRASSGSPPRWSPEGMWT